MTLTQFRPGVAIAAAACFSAIFTGCTLQTTSPVSIETTVVPGAAISGTVHGGSQPIINAKVYLLAVSPSGYGGPGIAPSAANASVSLLNPAKTGNAIDSLGSYVLTDANGGFNLAGDFACSTGYKQGTTTSQTPYSANQAAGTEQVYLYILGGQSSVDSPSANPNSGLLAALGPCNSPTQTVTVNEITTVATAYAFAGFASDATHIGSSGSALAITNLSNAFANVANIGSISAGTVTPSSATAVRSISRVPTIANILSACVNSNGSGSGCSTLFQYTESAGATGTAALDTATAAINLAHNPWPTAAGMTALFGLVPATGAPFSGSLTAAPTDFTIGVRYLGGGLKQPRGLAIDAAGNVWAANYAGSSLTEFSNAGTLISTSAYTGGGLSSPSNLAIDTTGNVWVANVAGTVSGFSSLGVPITTSAGYTTLANATLSNITIDPFQDIWVTDSTNNAIYELFNSGTSTSTVLFASSDGGINAPQGLASDVAGNIWIANTNSTLSEFSNARVAISPSNGFSGGGVDQPSALAFDPAGNLWVANFSGGDGNGSVSDVSPNPFTAVSTSGYSNTLEQPQFLAVDSAGTVWVTGGKKTSAFSNAGAPLCSASGFTGGGPNGTEGIAVDGSGNVWTASYNNTAVVVLIGAGSPVVTPVVANLVAPYGNLPVNRP